MDIVAILEDARREVEKRFDTRTPLNAAVGAGDLAVEKLRAARRELRSRASRFDGRIDVATLRRDLAGRLDRLGTEVRCAPDQVATLPERAQTLASGLAADALQAYGDLAARGERLVRRIRNQRATGDLEQQATSTVTKAKATATTARKAAAGTKRSAKATATSGRKTAKAAAKATRAGSKKVGA
ncbi:MAG TPA: hypothetical protein VFI30_04995 [Nocardioidaceae bacterium]|nr:hypothetical protein [Nocardioidaceae bacterium]